MHFNINCRQGQPAAEGTRSHFNLWIWLF